MKEDKFFVGCEVWSGVGGCGARDTGGREKIPACEGG